MPKDILTKEEIMMKHCCDNGLIPMSLGKSILAAMVEFADQEVKDALSKNFDENELRQYLEKYHITLWVDGDKYYAIKECSEFNKPKTESCE